MCARLRILTSGEGSLIHCFRPVLPRGSYLRRGWRVAPQLPPDGRKIAFESTRSGYYEVWLCRSDGSGLIQLTHFNSVTGTPRWSPDGQQIAFDSAAPGNTDIFVIDSQGGAPRNLTSEPSSEVVPSWSRDGRWIYFASKRTGSGQVWKMPPTGVIRCTSDTARWICGVRIARR